MTWKEIVERLISKISKGLPCSKKNFLMYINVVIFLSG